MEFTSKESSFAKGFAGDSIFQVLSSSTGWFLLVGAWKNVEPSHVPSTRPAFLAGI